MNTSADCWVGNVYQAGCWPLADRIPVAVGVFAAWLASLLFCYAAYRWGKWVRSYLESPHAQRIHPLLFIYLRYITYIYYSIPSAAVAFTVIFLYVEVTLLLGYP